MTRLLLFALLAVAADDKPARFEPIPSLPMNHDPVFRPPPPSFEDSLTTMRKKTYQQAQTYLGPVYWGVGLGFNNADHLAFGDREKRSRDEMNQSSTAKVLYRLFFEPKTGAYANESFLSLETKEEGIVGFPDETGLYYRFASAAAERLGKGKDKAEIEKLVSYVGKDPARRQKLAKNLADATKQYGHNPELGSIFTLIRSLSEKKD